MQIHRDGSSALSRLASWSLPLTCLLATSCYDSAERCGEGQAYSDADQLCLCRPGLTATPSGCEKPPKTPAGETPTGASDDDEVEQDSGVADGPGSVQPEPEPEPDGLGQPCSTNADCTGSDATFCDALITGGCLVEGCSTAGSDCPVGYECQDLSMFGAAGNVCVAAACDVASDDCPDGFTCCAAPVPGFPAACRSGGCGG